MTRKNSRLIQDVPPHGTVFDDRSEVERNEGMPRRGGEKTPKVLAKNKMKHWIQDRFERCE
ncbi:hypothetical protein SAMN04515656_104118 [Eubacterium aggregans]|uniref:Uncharacterized protein n=1 Tax=Eubacterium aggregans TaxID=81409 RepID=A0A1H3YUB4_9FIRM|nr:hypothetical protein [Eubacterium aggregans]SEA15155.1 hypothetical protein SAMN04515656_104118 [Eubacterium aggregans]